jgi:hypothetical protein
LWIIDERLAYHGFLASDMPLNAASVLSNDSGSRPDLMIFERALTFAEDDSALNSLVIVEFKKPDRSDYRKEDPVDQVYRLIREIRSGHFKDKNGREIKVQSDLIPAYAYVICVTLKAYEKAGGTTRRDLFSDDDSGVYIADPALLDKLVTERLEKNAKAVRAEGWKRGSSHPGLRIPANRRIQAHLCRACSSDSL